MENLRFKFIANNFVCYFVFCSIFCAFVCTKSNAQLHLWNSINDRNENSQDKTNFILVFSAQSAFSKSGFDDFSQRTSQLSSPKKKFIFQPSFEMAGSYRFGKKIDPRYWIGINIETAFSFPLVSSKSGFVIGFDKYISVCLFYDVVAIKMPKASDIRGLSVNYYNSHLPGARIDLDWNGILGIVSYEKSSKFELLDTEITYDFISDHLSVGISGKTIYGSGPKVIWSFGENVKQIYTAWLIPKNNEKEKYEVSNTFYLGFRFFAK